MVQTRFICKRGRLQKYKKLLQSSTLEPINSLTFGKFENFPKVGRRI